MKLSDLPVSIVSNFKFTWKTIAFLVIYLCITIRLFGGEGIEILERQIDQMPDDTVKVNNLIKLGRHYCSINNDKALVYLQEAFALSSTLDFKAGNGKSLLWQGRVYYYKDDYLISNKYFSKAEKILKDCGYDDDLSFLYFAIGENRRINGDYVSAFDAYKNALELAEKTGNIKYKSTFYSSIGRVLIDKHDPEKALQYLRQALIEKEKINDLNGISNNYTAIGMAYEQMNNLDSSLWYYNEALKIRMQINNERTIAGSNYNVAGILIKMKKYEEAEKSLQIAKLNFNKFDEKTGVIITNLRLALARSNLGKKDAISLADTSLSMAKEINNLNLISHAYKVLSKIFYNFGNYKLSYDYITKHKAIDDSLFSIEKTKYLTEFEEKFQSERKDREIEYYKARSKIQKQNNILLVVFLVATIGFAVLLFFLFRLKSTTVIKQKLLIEKEHVIHLQDKKLVEQDKQRLKEQLEAKNRELASKALEMIRLNDTITQIIEKLGIFKSTTNSPEVSKHIKEIIHALETQTKQNIWNEFNKIFKNIHSEFYSRLLEMCPDLTATEIKTAALLRLNLNTKEIASISFKSEGGVKTIRYRIRKKLNLGSDEKLIPFLMQI